MYMSISVCIYVGVSVCTMPAKSEEGVVCPGTKVGGVCEPPCGQWKSN